MIIKYGGRDSGKTWNVEILKRHSMEEIQKLFALGLLDDQFYPIASLPCIPVIIDTDYEDVTTKLLK